MEAAELVPEAGLLRLTAGPHASLPDFVYLLGCRVASLRRLLDERVVGRLHVGLHSRALVWRERAYGGIEVRVLALGHALHVHAELLERAVDHEFGEHDADRAGEG